MIVLLFARTSVATTGSVSLGLAFTVHTRSVAQASEGQDYPSVQLDVAFPSEPLTFFPSWSDLSLRGRGLSTARGRSYEFDRMETGTLGAALSNRDAALSPENSQSPYTPIRSTRPLRAQLIWGVPPTTFPLFRGISEGYPQSYPHLGKDAIVELHANDLFYALNNSRFTPGSTTLTTALEVVAQNTEATITVGSTILPLPQAVPFTITVAGLTDEWPSEDMEVQEVLSATEYRVLRSQDPTWEHPSGAAVTTSAVSFAEEQSGTRIERVLDAVGFDSSWWDIDPGQSLITASGDLAAVSPLEHINLIADAEFGRFFVSRAGLFTFRDRHSVILDHLAPVFTFKDGADTTSGEVPFVIEGALEHSDEKLHNRVRITIVGGNHDGVIVDVSDQASIDQHFERVFERAFPYANLNDAVSAAQFVLTRSSEDTLRLPAIVVQGVKDPENLWPLLLARELGDRLRFRYQPEGGGDEIDKDVVIEGISHKIAPMQHSTSFQCTEVDAQNYWILGLAGYSELGDTTVVAF